MSKETEKDRLRAETLREAADAIKAQARLHVTNNLGHMTWAECTVLLNKRAELLDPTTHTEKESHG